MQLTLPPMAAHYTFDCKACRALSQLDVTSSEGFAVPLKARNITVEREVIYNSRSLPASRMRLSPSATFHQDALNVFLRGFCLPEFLCLFLSNRFLSPTGQRVDLAWLLFPSPCTALGTRTTVNTDFRKTKCPVSVGRPTTNFGSTFWNQDGQSLSI